LRFDSSQTTVLMNFVDQNNFTAEFYHLKVENPIICELFIDHLNSYPNSYLLKLYDNSNNFHASQQNIAIFVGVVASALNK